MYQCFMQSFTTYTCIRAQGNEAIHTQSTSHTSWIIWVEIIPASSRPGSTATAQHVMPLVKYSTPSHAEVVRGVLTSPTTNALLPIHRALPLQGVWDHFICVLWVHVGEEKKAYRLKRDGDTRRDTWGHPPKGHLMNPERVLISLFKPIDPDREGNSPSTQAGKAYPMIRFQRYKDWTNSKFKDFKIQGLGRKSKEDWGGAAHLSSVFIYLCWGLSFTDHLLYFGETARKDERAGADLIFFYSKKMSLKWKQQFAPM